MLIRTLIHTAEKIKLFLFYKKTNYRILVLNAHTVNEIPQILIKIHTTHGVLFKKNYCFPLHPEKEPPGFARNRRYFARLPAVAAGLSIAHN